MKFKITGLPEINEMVKNLGIKSEDMIKELNEKMIEDIRTQAKKDMELNIRRYHWKVRQFWRT